MAEERVTSSTGGQKGKKSERYDLLPKPALDEIARVYAFGAIKYEDHNWRRGYDWSLSYAAAQRHLTAWWAGEDKDEESGLSHVAHAGFHIFAMLFFESLPEYAQFDDRYKPEVPEETPDETFQRLYEDTYVVASPLYKEADIKRFVDHMRKLASDLAKVTDLPS